MLPALRSNSWSAIGLCIQRISTPQREREAPSNVQRCVLRHFAVASMELARSTELSEPAAARYAAAEARFRAMLQLQGDIRDRPSMICPAINVGSGATLSLTQLFLDACQHYGWSLPHHSIDQNLIQEAKELLRGLDWHLPA